LSDCRSGIKMEPVKEKESKKQHRIEEENKRLEEAAKKKQKRQLEEINKLEKAASKKMEKQKKDQLNEAAKKNKSYNLKK